LYGTIVVTNSGGAAGSDLAGINTAPPLTMPATAAGWLVASNAELYLGIGSGVEAAPITINGPGYGAGYGAIRLDSGTISGNILLNGSTTNNQIGGAGASAVTFSGVISDGGRNYGLNVIGAGSTPASKVFVLSGQNTYGGQTTLSAGELQVAAAENPGISGPLGRSNALSTLYFSASGSAGALQYSSANQYDYSARFATSAGQKYKIDVNGQSVSFASPLTSSGGTFLLFDTAGGGTLTFNAANTYTGGTTISNGTLDVGSGSIVGGVTVNGGILQLDNPASLSPGTTLTLVSGVTVNLNYAGTQEITDLFVDGTQQMPGVYGTGANNPSGIFIGSGTLTVVGKSPTTVSSAAINGANQLAISWASVPGANYNVYSTTNLSQPIYWTLVNPSPIPAAGTTTSYTLPGSIVGQPQLFVRVQQ
jgi:autotransporter-associated beta strand protein